MRTRTLLEMRESLMFRADIEYDTDRHPVAQLNQEINESLDDFRSRMTVDGCALYLELESGVLPTTPPVARGNYVEITAPATMNQIVGIDVVLSNSSRSLEQITMRQRLSFGQYPGTPEAWQLLDFEARTVAIYPVPQQGWNYTLWYQTQLTPMTDDTDTWIVLPGFFDTVVWDTVRRIAVRDKLNELEQSALREYAVAWEKAKKAAFGVALRDNWRKPTRQRREYSEVSSVERRRAR